MKLRVKHLPMVTTLFITACGQAPSFVDSGQNMIPGRMAPGGGGTGSGDGTAASDGVASENGFPTTQNTASAQTSPTSSGTSPTIGSGTSAPIVFQNEPGNPSSPTFSVPNLTPDEASQLGQCIKKWGRVPFTGNVTNVKRIKAAVTVYGIGVAINDQSQTATPALILVDAGVNVLGNATYNMMNNNGYYCMKVNVNVNTSLDINLACNAHLADSSVQVDVNSTSNSTTSAVGVNVGSNVKVNQVMQSGQACTN